MKEEAEVKREKGKRRGREKGREKLQPLAASPLILSWRGRQGLHQHILLRSLRPLTEPWRAPVFQTPLTHDTEKAQAPKR